MKKYFAVFMAALMSLGTAVSVSAASFSDINNVPWEGAKEYINKVADLGLMVGDTDKSGNKVFRAKDRITYCEAMQLAYSVLEKTGSLKTSENTVSKWTDAMKKADIPQWAYTAVAYGLESGIVSTNDIEIFIKDDGTNRDSTRENVAVIFGKALSHISKVNTSAELSFKDKAEITATSVPYIDLLARLGILVGDSDGNFNPKNYINRAEMAVIASKSYEKINELKKSEEKPETPATQDFSGTIILTDDGSDNKTIAVSENETGKTATFTLNSSTPVITEDGKTKKYEDITVGDMVTVTTANGVVVSVRILVDNENIDEDKKDDDVLEGYLNNITSRVITFDTEDGEQKRYEFSSNPRITLNGGLVSKDDLYEYVVDRNTLFIKVTLDENGEVDSLSAEFSDVEGELTNIKDGDLYIKSEYADKKKTVKVTMSNDCEIYLDDEKISESKAEDLFDDKDGGYYAKAEVDNFNKATKVEIFRDTYTEGELKKISSSSIEIKTSFGRTVEFDIDDDAEFVLNGGESTYKKIKNALEDADLLVTLEFDDDDVVTKVRAQMKEIKGELKAADNKKIVIVDEDDNRMSLEYDRDIECKFDGEKVTYSKFQKLYKDAESKVVAKAELDDNGAVTKISAYQGSESEGTVVSISSSEITFEDAAGIEHNYKVEPAARGYINEEELFPASKVLDYAREDGAHVRVTFSSRGYVNRIFITLEE